MRLPIAQQRKFASQSSTTNRYFTKVELYVLYELFAQINFAFSSGCTDLGNSMAFNLGTSLVLPTSSYPESILFVPHMY